MGSWRVNLQHRRMTQKPITRASAALLKHKKMSMAMDKPILTKQKMSQNGCTDCLQSNLMPGSLCQSKPGQALEPSPLWSN